MRWLLWAALCLGACAPAEAEKAERWTIANALKPKSATADFGGWTPARLAVNGGDPLPFGEGNQFGSPGVVIQPGVADGVATPFIITEVWRNHPTPWVEPVWAPRDAAGQPVLDVKNVFSVNVDSSFYSPFWRLEYLLKDGVTPETFRSARDSLATSADITRRPGPLVLCPVVVESAALGATSSGPRDPATGATLAPLPLSTSWHEGEKLWYFDFGPGRFDERDQLPVVERAYFFVKLAGQPVLPVASVLPSNPKLHGFVQRVDVRLPPKAAVYVPSSRPELLTVMMNADVPVAQLAAGNDGVTARTLQVVLDKACLETGAIADCTWLDSVAAIERAALPTFEQPVTLTVGVLP